MVLKGGKEGYSIPFDSALYGSTIPPRTPASEIKIEYRNCEALAALFETSKRVEELIPEGLELFSDPPHAAVWFSKYPFSTLGEYDEGLLVIQVRDMKGEMGYYIPYIYVTNDAAMAAGREIAGAPKKLAHIGFEKELDVIQATLERPKGKRLLTFTFKPEERATMDAIRAAMPRPIPLFSVRHLPPIKGGDGITQLVKWYAEIDFHKDLKGVETVWTGPASITYDSHSSIDPIHRIEIRDLVAAIYLQFDMTLGITEVQREYKL